MKDWTNRNGVLTHQDKAGVVAAYRQSGVSLKEFARQRGMRPSRLHYWVYQKDQSAKPRSPTVESQGTTGVFQEVKLEASSALLRSWAVEVSLPRGLDVRFSASASAEWIGSVVQALHRPC